MQVISTKYDGTLRDSYEAQLLDHDGPMLRLGVPAGTPVFDGRRGRTVQSDDTAVELYFEDRWYNVWHLREHTVFPNLWYANVAMPAVFDGEKLQWTDLDIDVRCHLDGSLTVLDEDEFEYNRVEMGYPAEVVEQALSARDEILRLGRAGASPFDYEAQIANATRLS